jgi:glycosyltransferase involved in cell wall biosynthesis
MANQWVARGDHVTLITLDEVSRDVYPVDPRVVRVGLGWMRAANNVLQAGWNNLGRMRALRRAIHAARPQCVVSVTDQMNILTMAACRHANLPVVLAEHSDPRHQPLGRVRERLRRWLYPQAAAIVVLTQPVADYLRTMARDCPVYVIPNAVSPPAMRAGAGSHPREQRIAALGRLSPEKGFDLLLEAFAELAPQHPEWQLTIAGEGPERCRLQHCIERLRLQSRVTLVGWVDDPLGFLSRAEVFVLSSRYEGFPVSLLEAMSCGLAVVSFDCDSGPREIIRHERDGLLVPPADTHALAAALARLMRDVPLRASLGTAAREVVERFSIARFEAEWDAVLRSVLKHPE